LTDVDKRDSRDAPIGYNFGDTVRTVDK